MTSLATSLSVAQLLECPTSVQRRSWVQFPSGTRIFSLSHALDKLNIPSFSFLSELKIYHLSSLLSHTVLSTWLILAVCRTRVTPDSVNVTLLARSLSVAQRLEHPNGVWEVMGSIPVWDSDFFLCPTLVTN